MQFRYAITVRSRQRPCSLLFKVAWIFTFAAAAYNLVRMRNLLPGAT